MSELNTQNPAGGEPAPATAPAGEPTPQTPPMPPTFTQEQVSGIVAKESKKAVEKLLQDAGLPVEGDYKSQLAAFKQWTDSQKTEAQLAAERAEQEAQRAAQLEQELSRRDKQIAALGKGIPAEKMQQYITLADSYAGDGVDFAAGLDKALADFPVSNPQATLQSFGGPTNTPKPDKAEKYREAMGLKRRN